MPDEKKKPTENYEVIEIGGKEYNLYTGFAFIRELDKRYPTASDFYGIGLYTIMAGMDMRNTLSMLDYIQAATITEKQKPSLADIEITIGKWVEDDVIEDVFTSFMKRLETSGVTSPIVKKAMKFDK